MTRPDDDAERETRRASRCRRCGRVLHNEAYSAEFCTRDCETAHERARRGEGDDASTSLEEALEVMRSWAAADPAVGYAAKHEAARQLVERAWLDGRLTRAAAAEALLVISVNPVQPEPPAIRARGRDDRRSGR